MSTSISLIQMPKVPMEHILEYLDFPSILVIRKVCHKLQNFIDDTQPASHLTEIEVRVFSEFIRFSGYFDRSLSTGALMRRTEILIHYVRNGEGCSVRKFDKENEGIKRTIADDEDFVAVFRKDFNIILRHQKTVLEEFIIYLMSSNSTVNEKILKGVNKSLKSLNHPLQVKSLDMLVNNYDEILTILPYINPEALKKIRITERLDRYNVMLNLDEIGQFEQWKQAKELEVRGFQIPCLSQYLKHFSKISFWYGEIDAEKLLLIKETFLSSSTLTTMNINHTDCSSRDILQGVIKAFGKDLLETNEGRKWFFRIPDTNQFLSIHFPNDHIVFSRIEQSDVPQNAVIS